MNNFKIYNDNCLNVLKTMEDNSIDSCVTDPPYGIAFMGKDWDNFSTSKNSALGKKSPANEKSKQFPTRGKPIGGWSDADRQAAYNFEKWCEEWATEVYRVLKPGGFLLSFCSPRMYHRMTSGIEDAGFQIRDQIMWLYGSGFPKSHNIGKAIDAAAGATRQTVGKRKHPTLKDTSKIEESANAAHGDNTWKREWDITAPATEEAKQWEGWGTALKPAHEPIVVARKPMSEKNVASNVLKYGTGALNIDECRVSVDPQADASQLRTMQRGKRENDTSGQKWGMSKSKGDVPQVLRPEGRWPANVIHDGSDEVVSQFLNGSSRFFYCAKASKADREQGNNHPTVKPTELMKYLCRLVTPPNGIILDPFMGSGSTGKAALQEGFNFIGIEMNKEYYEIANGRISNVKTSNLEEFFK